MVKTNRRKTQERRTAITILLKQIGPWNISRTQLGKKYKVSDSTITRDIRAILKHMKPGQIDNLTLNLELPLLSAIKKTQRNLARTNDQVMIDRCSRTLALLIDNYTKLLEAWGIKDRIADKIDIETKTIDYTYFLEKYSDKKEEECSVEIVNEDEVV